LTKESRVYVLLRSKAEWVDISEKNSKYVANLEKKKAEQKQLANLKITQITLKLIKAIF